MLMIITCCKKNSLKHVGHMTNLVIRIKCYLAIKKRGFNIVNMSVTAKYNITNLL